MENLILVASPLLSLPTNKIKEVVCEGWNCEEDKTAPHRSFWSYLVGIAEALEFLRLVARYIASVDTRAMHKTCAKFNDVNHNVTTTRHDKLSRRIRTQVCTLDKSSCPQSIPAVYLHTDVHIRVHGRTCTNIFASKSIISLLVDKLLSLSSAQFRRNEFFYLNLFNNSRFKPNNVIWSLHDK